MLTNASRLRPIPQWLLAVTVFLGGIASGQIGIPNSTRYSFTQSPIPRAGARFGSAVAAGDFDGNGTVEIAVGIKNGKNSAGVFTGTVQIFGINGNFLYDLSAPPVTLNDGDEFGAELHAADVDPLNPGVELIVGAPNADIPSGQVDAGLAFIYKSISMAPLTHSVTLQAPGTPRLGDEFGAAITSGDFGLGTSELEVIIGVPFHDTAGQANAGAAIVFVDPILQQGQVRIELLAGAPCLDDYFGKGLATGQILSDATRLDLVVGKYYSPAGAAGISALGEFEIQEYDGVQFVMRTNQAEPVPLSEREPDTFFGWTVAAQPLSSLSEL